MEQVAFTLLPFVPLLAWVLLVGWTIGSTEGEVIARVPLPILARCKMLFLPTVMGLIVYAIGVAMDRIHWWLIVPLGAVFVAMIALPFSYVLTTAGIRMGRGQFRRWTEFAGVARAPGGAILQAGANGHSYPIFLGGNREDDDFVHTLRSLVRDAYKGKTIARQDLPATLTGNQDGGESRTTSSISH